MLGLQLWHLLKSTELTEVLSQIDKLFIDLLNKVRAGYRCDYVRKLRKARFIHESDENYPKDSLHMYAANEPAVKRNEAVLNELPDEVYVLEANDKILNNFKYQLALTWAAQNQKQTNRMFSQVA